MAAREAFGMHIDRRTMLGGMAATALAGSAMARTAASRSWYGSSTIIDGLGGISDPYGLEASFA